MLTIRSELWKLVQNLFGLLQSTGRNAISIRNSNPICLKILLGQKSLTKDRTTQQMLTVHFELWEIVKNIYDLSQSTEIYEIPVKESLTWLIWPKELDRRSNSPIEVGNKFGTVRKCFCYFSQPTERNAIL